MIETIEPLLDQMKRSGIYRVLVWAGGYKDSRSTSFSDIDLYAVSSKRFEHHWVMEKVGSRRVEVTMLPVDEWRDMLLVKATHPKHHYTFINGTALYDPEELLPGLRRLAQSSIGRFVATNDELEHRRYILSIQIDKLNGYLELQDMLQTRLHAVGAVYAISELLARMWFGYSLTSAKNFDMVLKHSSCPAELVSDLREILTTPSTPEMATHALRALKCALSLTGGDVIMFRGGIPR